MLGATGIRRLRCALRVAAWVAALHLMSTAPALADQPPKRDPFAALDQAATTTSTLRLLPPLDLAQRRPPASFAEAVGEALPRTPLAEAFANSPTAPAEQTTTGVLPASHYLTEPLQFVASSTTTIDEPPYPIDLPTVLNLAGANNLQIAIASERVNQARARHAAANVLWVPSLNGGVVYNNQAGRLQETEGSILEVSRGSLFVGGGAKVGGSSTAGGSSGPARMTVDLPLVDALFEPLAARQLVRASRASRNATFNNTLLTASAAYLELVRAQAQLDIAAQSVRDAAELAAITLDFSASGRGLQADAQRAQVEAASRQRDELAAKESLAIASANLARMLRLDPAVRLLPAEDHPTPIDFVDRSIPLRDLIDQAVAARPEIERADAERDAACFRQRQEQLRPWLPHLYAGMSGGGFGGGEGSEIENFGGRSDFDVAALWELENLGFGNAARQRAGRSAYRQANLAVEEARDRIAAEVVQSYQRVHLRHQQIEVTESPVVAAQQALQLNLEGIRGGALRPIEIQQAIGALASARRQYLDAIIDYNTAQLEMMRTLGQAPTSAH